MNKLYTTPNGEVMAIEEGQEFLIQPDWILMSQTDEDTFKNPPKTAEQLAQEASEARQVSMLAGSVYTLNGTDYTVSFTANDGNGMLQVKAAFELGLTNTVIRFDNGTDMPIAATEFSAFAVWFVTERNKFFVGV